MDKVDAIILACWESEDKDFNRLEIDPLLLPLPEQPMLHMVFQRVVDNGCRKILIVLGEHPQCYRDALQSYAHQARSNSNEMQFDSHGHTPALELRFCYATDVGQGNVSLAQIGSYLAHDQSTCLLANADSLPFSAAQLRQASLSNDVALCWVDSGFVSWTGWANLRSELLREILPQLCNRNAMEAAILNHQGIERMREQQPIATQDARLTLNSIHCLMHAKVRAGGGAGAVAGGDASAGAITPPCNAAQEKQGISIGMNCYIHPSAQLIGPIYIGDNVCIGRNACIGPNVILGKGSMVGDDTHLQTAYVFPNTFIGSHLQIQGAIANHLGILNVYTGSIACMQDTNILGSVSARQYFARVPFSHRMLAALLLPLVSMLAYRMQRTKAWPWQDKQAQLATHSMDNARADGDEIAYLHPIQRRFMAMHSRCNARHEAIFQELPQAYVQHFLYCFVPGLHDVIAGKIALVGLQPRNLAQISKLPTHWQKLYAHQITGLLNHNLLLGKEGACDAMRFAGDAMSSMSFFACCKLLLAYAKQVRAQLRSVSSNEEGQTLHSRQTPHKEARSPPHN